MLLKLILVALILITPLIPTFWAIFDIPKRQFPSSRSRLIWFAVVSTLPCIGAICYFIFGRRSTLPITAVPEVKPVEPVVENRQH